MKTTANIATHKARQDTVHKTVNSLAHQVDEVRVYANDFELDLDNAMVVSGPPDLTDNGKMYFLSEIEEDEIYFTCDDDILYPDDYVEHTLERLQAYPDCIVTYHGRRTNGQADNYYHAHETYNCRRDLPEDTQIDIPGTGVTAFNTKYFKPTNIWDCYDQKMCDILTGYEAAVRNVPVICLAHSMFWIKVHSSIGGIYKEEEGHDVRQAQIANEIHRINHG